MEKWKTRYKCFEYDVMSFKLTNAPTIFLHLMNNISHEFLDKFVVKYLNNIWFISKILKNPKNM